MKQQTIRNEVIAEPQETQTSAEWSGEKPSILIFDVHETLIDFEVMSPLFERVFGDQRVLREWLGHLITYSMTITLSGLYKDYFSLGQGLFEMVGAIHKVSVQPADVEALKKGMMTMPAHSDVEEGLKLLKDAGFRMVTLTNRRQFRTARAHWKTPVWPIFSSGSSALRPPAPISLRRSSTIGIG